MNVNEMINKKVKNPTVLFIVLILLGCGFGVAGFCVIPLGEIHFSVLIMVAQLFILAATVLIPNIKIDASLKDGELTIEKDNE